MSGPLAIEHMEFPRGNFDRIAHTSVTLTLHIMIMCYR